jgi:hypothetical protein
MAPLLGTPLLTPLCLLLLTLAPGEALHLQLSRRALLVSGASSLAASGCIPPAVAGEQQSFGDDMALIAAARQLDTALANWNSEIALIQLGRQGALQSSANMLQEESLKRLGAGAAGASFTKHKNAMCAFRPRTCRAVALPNMLQPDPRTSYCCTG